MVRRIRNNKFSLLFFITFTVLLGSYLLFGSSLVYGIEITRDVLYGDGQVETSDAFSSFLYTAGIDPVWDTVGANGTSHSIKCSWNRPTLSTGGDTAMADHPFITPAGLTSSTVEFYFKVDTSDHLPTSQATKVTVRVIDPATQTAVWSQEVYNTTALQTTFLKVGPYSIPGLQADKVYNLRLETYMYPVKSRPVYVNFDEVFLNMSWNDTVGPTFGAVTPGDNMYAQGTAELKAITTDPAGAKSVTWEYRPKDSGSLFTTIGTVTKTEPYSGTDTFTLSWDTTGLATGEYEVKLTATDGSGADNSTQTTRIYRVDNEGPTLSLVSPVDNSVASGYTQTLQATAADWSKVSEVSWDYWDDVDSEWVPIGQDRTPDSGNDSEGVYSVIWHTTNVRDGNYTVRIKAKDKSPAAVENAGLVLTYKVDNLKPKITEITPVDRSYVRGTGLVLSAMAPSAYEGNGIASVQWLYSQDEGSTWTQIGTDTSGESDLYSVTWDTTAVSDRKYLMKIIAANTLGNSNEAQFEYTVDNTSPVLVSASASSKNLVTVLFTEVNIGSSTSTNPANYRIYETANPANQLSVSAAEAKADGSGIKLTTADQTENVNYTLEITGTIYDNAGNPLAGGTTAAFAGNGRAKGNPHGGYDTGSIWCGTCHSAHAGEAEKLMSESKEKLVCYICHDDSGLSCYDVKKEFGAVDAVGANTSHHPVPEDEQKCVYCHDPHAECGAANPMLLKVTDGNGNVYKSGNNVCWACHGTQAVHGSTVAAVVGVPDIDDKEKYYTTAIGLDGGIVGVHVYQNNPLLAPPTYAGINCNSCHVPHGSSNPKLFLTKVNGTTVYGNSDAFCLSCHTDAASAGTNFLGKTVWEDTTFSAHSRTDSGSLWPGGGYGVDRSASAADRGKCINCHNVHGTPYGAGLVERFTVPAYNDTDALTNYAICFRCHGPTGVSKGVTTKNMTPYYQQTYSGTGTFGGTQGHFVKTANKFTDADGNYLEVGWKIPCTDCHNTHGSVGENRFLLKGDLNGESFNHLFKGTALSGRQFCIQCHRYSDDARGPAPYRNGTIALMPSTNPQHFSTGTIECNYCHGGGDLVKGAHAPNSGRSEGGLDCNLCHLTMASEMGTSSTRYRHQMTHFDADQPTDKYDASSLGFLQSKTCLSTCHTDHDVFNNDPEGEKRYLRASGGDVSGEPAAIATTYSVVDNADLGRRVTAVSSLCMTPVCHGTNGSLDDLNYTSPSNYTGTSNLYSQIRSTVSTHAMSADPKNTYVDADTLTPEFYAIWSARTEKRLVCTDCHQDETTGASFDLKRQGPHSSNNLYMLKATGSVFYGYQTYDSLCNLCHQSAVYGGNGTYGTGTGSRTPTTHSQTKHYEPAKNRSGCLGCHCGNREGFGSVGATRGSIHGTDSTDKFLNGNYISSHPIGSSSCTMQTTDPGASGCNYKHTTAVGY